MLLSLPPPRARLHAVSYSTTLLITKPENSAATRKHESLVPPALDVDDARIHELQVAAAHKTVLRYLLLPRRAMATTSTTGREAWSVHRSEYLVACPSAFELRSVEAPPLNAYKPLHWSTEHLDADELGFYGESRILLA